MGDWSPGNKSPDHSCLCVCELPLDHISYFTVMQFDAQIQKWRFGEDGPVSDWDPIRWKEMKK